MAVFGFVFNMIIFAVFKRKKFDKASSRNFFCLMSITETLSLLTMLPYNLSVLGFDIMTYNSSACKIFTFTLFYFPILSTWLLVLINIERFVSIKYGSAVALGKIAFQLKILGALFLWNLVFYLIYTYHTVLVHDAGNILNQTNLVSIQKGNSSTAHCSLRGPVAILSWLHVTNSLILPFCSIAIIESIYLARKKMRNICLAMDLQRHKRDIRFSFLIVSLSIAFLAFNIPIVLYSFSQCFAKVLLSFILNIIFYFQYIFNIFVYVLLNAKFKEELRLMFKIKSKRKSLKFRKQLAKFRNLKFETLNQNVQTTF